MRPVFAFLLLSFFALSSSAKMVYLHQVGENRRVVLAEDDGSFLRFLTSENQQAYHPEISSDGRYVAYSIGVIELGRKIDVAIHVEDLQSGDIEVWTPSGNQYIHAEFSGNGEYLSYSAPIERNGRTLQNIQWVHLPSERKKGPVRTEVHNGRKYHFFRTTPETIESPFHGYFPALSSDGNFIVFHQTEDPKSKTTPKHLAMYDRRSKKLTELTPRNGSALVPSLSYDNRWVAYASVEEGIWDLRLMDLWTKQSRKITDSPAREFTPVFAPDNSITYTHIIEGENFDLDLYRIDAKAVFNKSRPAEPRKFLGTAAVMEYVPSFSGNLQVELREETKILDPARSSFGAVEHRGKIYIAGGHQGPEHTYPPESFMKRMEIFDEKTKTWSRAADLNLARHGFQIIAHKGFIYAFGGFTYSAKHRPGWKSVDLIERYDIANNVWEVLPVKLTRPRSSNVVAKVGNQVYIIGGWNSTPKHDGDLEGRFHREIDVFDLETETLSESPYRLPDPLRRAFTGVVVEDEILLLGGISEGSSHFDWIDRVTSLNTKTGEWKEYPRLPFATFAPGAGVLNGKVYLFGGMNKTFSYLNTVFEFDFYARKPWLNTGRYLKENKGFPQVVHLPHQALGILGGHTYRYPAPGRIEDSPVDSFEVFRVNQTSTIDLAQ